MNRSLIYIVPILPLIVLLRASFYECLAFLILAAWFLPVFKKKNNRILGRLTGSFVVVSFFILMLSPSAVVICSGSDVGWKIARLVFAATLLFIGARVKSDKIENAFCVIGKTTAAIVTAYLLLHIGQSAKAMAHPQSWINNPKTVTRTLDRLVDFNFPGTRYVLKNAMSNPTVHCSEHVRRQLLLGAYRLKPDDPELMMELGLVMLEENKADDGATLFYKALPLLGSAEKISQAKTILLFFQREKNFVGMAEFIAQNPQIPMIEIERFASGALATELFLSGNTTTAKRIYEIAHSANALLSLHRLHFAELVLSQGKSDRALALLDESPRLEWPQGEYLRALICSEKGDINFSKKILSRFSEFPLPHPKALALCKKLGVLVPEKWETYADNKPRGETIGNRITFYTGSLSGGQWVPGQEILLTLSAEIHSVMPSEDFRAFYHLRDSWYTQWVFKHITARFRPEIIGCVLRWKVPLKVPDIKPGSYDLVFGYYLKNGPDYKPLLTTGGSEFIKIDTITIEKAGRGGGKP